MLSLLTPDGIRHALYEHPRVALGVVGVLLAFAGLMVVHSTRSVETPLVFPPAYFTVDDGQTLFADSPGKISPFEHEGQEAVRAYVESGSDGRQRVTYLEKWTAEARKRLDGPPGKPPPAEALLIKRPGDPTWCRPPTPGRATLSMVCRATRLRADRQTGWNTH